MIDAASRPRSPRWVEPTLCVLFALSGGAGLIYESIWARYLGLFVGHTAYAQIIVLATFLGGMSLGAVIASQFTVRLEEPLLWYAAVELVVGLIGLIFHQVFIAVTGAAYETILPVLQESWLLTPTRWLIAALLILPQSILLGSSFPFMSAAAIRRTPKEPGRLLALLYFSNSIGAAMSVLVAGFYLISAGGLPGAVTVASMLNVLVAVSTYLIARTVPIRQDRTEGDSPTFDASAEPRPPSQLWYGMLLLSFATAIASFFYEIGWIRMLSLVLGSATHSFELMLSAFILGLAFGALWLRTRADRFREPIATLGAVQWLKGFTAIATLPLYIASFGWTSSLLAAFSRTEPGYVGFKISQYAICLAVMFASTFCAGITLPLITRSLLVKGFGEASIGWVYGINTLGSIVGVALGGLVLMPLVGLKGLLVVAATLDMVLGVFLLGGSATARGRKMLVAAVATLLVVVTVSMTTTLDRSLLISGVYRHGGGIESKSIEVPFYQDGRTASVAVARPSPGNVLFIRTNGKTDGALPVEWISGEASEGIRKPLSEDLTAQVLLPLMTLAHAPRARTAAMIGQGTGMSSHMLLGNPLLEKLTTIEIEPAMIEGSRHFLPANRRVFEDPRSSFVMDDAKSFFATRPSQFDLIVSEPSNPWVSGVASLFTAEFYQRVRNALSDEGIFGQWLQVYEIDDDLVLTALAALHQSFPSYTIFLLDHGNLLVVASKRTLPSADWSIFQGQEIASDLRLALPLLPEQLEATRLLDRAALAPLLDHWGQPNSDFFPVLDLGAERARFQNRSADGFVGLGSDRFLLSPFLGRRALLSPNQDVAIVTQPRLVALSRAAALRETDSAHQRNATTGSNSAQSVMRYWQWKAGFLSDNAPPDWRQWVAETFAIEADLNGGTAGINERAFFDSLDGYLRRHSAPIEACASVAFLEGLASWDFNLAARAGDRLLGPAVEGGTWLPVDLLRDGAVISHLMTGDRKRAALAFNVLSLGSRRPVDDLRSRLLQAYLEHFDDVKLPDISVLGPIPRATRCFEDFR